MFLCLSTSFHGKSLNIMIHICDYRNNELPEGGSEEGQGRGESTARAAPLRRAPEPPAPGAPAEAPPGQARLGARCVVPPTDNIQVADEIVTIDVRNNDPCYENGRFEVLSPSHFHLDLSPNLNRPDNVYEPSEEPSTSTAPTHWRFKMFKTGSKNSKQSLSRDGVVKNKMHSFGEYDMPKISGKMSDKSFLSKGKNKAKISPIVNACSEQVSSSSASPLGLNVCFGKKLLRSPSNSQTLEFNDRSSEGREGAGEGVATCPRSVAVPRSHGSVYGRLGNTYGRLHILGSGIGRIERHLSSSCGNIDHYCTAPTQGNPRFRIENQSVEADRIYQHIESTVEEAPAAAPPPGIKGISKGSLQWLMVNRWLPLWVANSGGKNEYKVIDLDFSIYDDVRYPMCTAACADEHCMGRNAEAYSLYRKNYLGGQLSLGREQGLAGSGTSPSANRCAGAGAEPFPSEEGLGMPGVSGNMECDSPEPDSSSGENYVVDNEQDLSTADNEPSVSECSRSAAEGSSSSEGSSPATDTTHSSQPTPSLPLQTNHSA